ncbi:glucosylceramidase [Jejuia pallidilutea]|uniref:Glucosylceramidase n=1 Tax=Jejuia pallidilutea TaxID=504487 RepID=A0A362X1V2_9FLAO|nr:beta-glycosidase [Jejuia pallidilutea]PQV50205.1 glucosylceramidase [Jejuia pallidilutea]
MKLIKGIILGAIVVFSSCKEDTKVTWVSSTNTNVWEQKTYEGKGAKTAADLTISVDTKNQEQKITGFGGCFNELGWEALNMVTPEEKQQILNDLFNLETGCKFSVCRMPIGANDYAVDWYSHNETEGDFAMENFSIDRDKKRLIPYIKEAQKINPDVEVWASPWCPPSWMKHSKHYACKSNPEFNDLPEEWSSTEELVSRFITEPEYFEAYALYFAKFVKAYEKEGIDITAVHVQNEYNSAQNFPSCVWKPQDLGILIADYLGPKFKEENLDTEIWLGTVERPQLERVTDIVEYKNAKDYIKGIGFQWAGKGAIEAVHATYPDMELMQTETECGDGSNDWNAAEYTFNLMKHYFENGANSYMYWNMVLDETGKSQWGWKQNSMISIDSNTKAITYNPEFYLMKHLSAFVAPGSVKLKATGDDENAIVFYNEAKNEVVILAYNTAEENQGLELKINDKDIKATLEAKSFNTLTVTL